MALSAALNPDSLPVRAEALRGKTSFGLSRMLLSLGWFEVRAGAFEESEGISSGEEAISEESVEMIMLSCFVGESER